jgi:hypothetical protein
MELAFSPSPGLKRQDIFPMGLHWKLTRAPQSSTNSKYGAAGAPDYDGSHIQKISLKQHLHEGRSGI